MQMAIAKIGVVLACFFCSLTAGSQQCTNRFSSVIYRSLSWDTFTRAIATPAGEWVTAGNIIDDHGMIAKFSPKGTPLFSYQYIPVYQFNTTFFAKLKFTDIRQTKDGSFVAVGNVLVDKWIGLLNFINFGGVVLKIDPYGNVLWCKRLMTAQSFNSNFYSLSATNVLETTSGDLVVYVAADVGKHYSSYGKVVCFTKDGQQKWITKLATADFDGGLSSLQTKRALLQANDGSIVVGDILHKTDRDSSQTKASMLHFFGLSAATGKPVWESFYEYPLVRPADRVDFTSGAELASGNFVFTLSSYPTASGRKGLRIETDKVGRVVGTTTYHTADGMPTELVDVSRDQNTRKTTYFLKTPAYSLMATVDEKGQPLTQKGFDHANDVFPGSCMAATDKGYAIFMSSFRNRDMRILYTGENGTIDCANIPVQLSTQSVVLQEAGRLKTETDLPDPPGYGAETFPIVPAPNPLPSRIECEEVEDCCTDIVDSTNRQPVQICEGSSFRLPDGTSVTQSGTYYVVYKTSGGCDSIRFYQVAVDKNPAALSLGQDLCFAGKDTLLLKATAGYDLYRWSNGTTGTDSLLKVTATGEYRVTVSNSCGSKTDTLMVHSECNFPVFMPNAFSPNGDGLNDVFRVPPANKNSFLALRIYNRWGELIFHTGDPFKGWDGRIKGIVQPTGVYVYHLEMRGLSGQRITKTGTITLIR